MTDNNYITFHDKDIYFYEHAYDLHMTWTKLVKDFKWLTLDLHDLQMTCAWLEHDLQMTCTWLEHDLNMTWTWFAHDLQTHFADSPLLPCPDVHLKLITAQNSDAVWTWVDGPLCDKGTFSI